MNTTDVEPWGLGAYAPAQCAPSDLSKGGNCAPSDLPRAIQKSPPAIWDSWLQTSSGAMGIRTPDLLNAIEALYQLSYDPENTNHIPPFSLSQGKPLACGIPSG